MNGDKLRSVSEKTINRLSLYRRLLENRFGKGHEHVFSHELAELACVTPAQVRRDLMCVDNSGSTSRGYSVQELVREITAVLDAPGGQRIALVGVGNLGRAILSYFSGRRPGIAITAAFDSDPSLAGRVINGCRCHPMSELSEVLRGSEIGAAIVAVPASAAQDIADRLVAAGVRGILNFAPVPLKVPEGVFLEHRDMTMSLETVAFFARRSLGDAE